MDDTVGGNEVEVVAKKEKRDNYWGRGERGLDDAVSYWTNKQSNCGPPLPWSGWKTGLYITYRRGVIVGNSGNYVRQWQKRRLMTLKIPDGASYVATRAINF